MFDYRNCKLCNGLGVIPERPRKDEKDFPTLIRCPNCQEAEIEKKSQEITG